MQIKTMVAATNNLHKLTELREILGKHGIRIISQKDAGLNDIDVDETGETFEENSYIKAAAIAGLTRLPAIADDSGLCVAALEKSINNQLIERPGVYSARFYLIDEEVNNITHDILSRSEIDLLNNEKLLDLLKNVPVSKRMAKFVSVITMVMPTGTNASLSITTRGECHGTILTSPQGSGGFGYDPLFLPNGLDKTFAEIDADTKNNISHRSNALTKFIKLLEEKTL